MGGLPVYLLLGLVGLGSGWLMRHKKTKKPMSTDGVYPAILISSTRPFFFFYKKLVGVRMLGCCTYLSRLMQGWKPIFGVPCCVCVTD
ncbi:hypothetical protein QBC41DRAFT_314726 [Cercophora samala]|uniref:Uncharacterized protein n=1 Tax=Cercophora samala TaxID=330535 RepID=A0AA39ZJF6_9PEZI|nr:hypothetical protein QBC41DRAFT_314726 [Cercophora samala]